MLLIYASNEYHLLVKLLAHFSILKNNKIIEFIVYFVHIYIYMYIT